jgi:hypothetical protein
MVIIDQVFDGKQVLPMVSGCLVDLCGIPMLTVTLATTCLVGQVAFAVGTGSKVRLYG